MPAWREASFSSSGQFGTKMGNSNRRLGSDLPFNANSLDA